MKSIIYGKNYLNRIVSIQPEDDHCIIFRQDYSGGIVAVKVDNCHYAIFKRKLSNGMVRLRGDQPFKYLYKTTDRSKFYNVTKKAYQDNEKFFQIKDRKEAFMVRNGYTYYKDLKPQDISILSFDLEHSFGIGQIPKKRGQLLIISTTGRKNGKITKRLFSLDEFESEAAMLKSWCLYVREYNPSILMGHNIFGHDLQILCHVADKNDIKLDIGRDGSEIEFFKKQSSFRKDGSQAYDYFNASVYGRELIDTYFLSIKYDTERNYESYGLKAIIKHEGLEKKDRVHYDASQIEKDWKDLDKRKQIKQYAMDDSEDCIKLFDLMASSFFYYTQSIPMSFQSVINRASGSQLNSLMVRAYLQDGYSIAEGDDKEEFEGAISLGNPGIYKNVFKIDVASLYPSIMRQWKIFSEYKDPKSYLPGIVEYFTIERLKNKQTFKETGNKYFDDMSKAQKIIINSMYGFLGAPNLNYNYAEGAAQVTGRGRKILNRAIKWSKELEFKLVNADTDSISFCKKDQKKFTEEERIQLLTDINSRMPELIRWEDDGLFKTVIVVKKKNYILQKSKTEIKIKGSGLKATMKEKALQKYIKEVIQYLLTGRKDKLFNHYMAYINQIQDLKDISEWCSKKTFTKSIINPERTQESRMAEALVKTDINEGDKFYIFFKTKESVSLQQDFDGTYYKPALFRKIYNTLKIFKNIIDIDLFPNYSLKSRAKEPMTIPIETVVVYVMVMLMIPPLIATIDDQDSDDDF